MYVKHGTLQPDPEPLLYYSGNPTRSIVVKASSIAADVSNDNRRILLPGTLMTKAASAGADGKGKYIKYAGTGVIAGVLKTKIEVVDGTVSNDQPAALYYIGETFNAKAIVDYSTYGDVAASTLAVNGGNVIIIPGN